MLSIIATTGMAAEASAQCGHYTMEIVPPPVCPIFGPMGMLARDANSTGYIVGRRSDCNFDYRAFIWNGSEIIDLPGPPELPDVEVVGVNDLASCVGRMEDHADASTKRGFLRLADRMINLGTPPQGNVSEAHALNESHQVCGEWAHTVTGPVHAFIWQNGVMTDLSLPIGPNHSANDINDIGQIVGWMGNAPFPPFHAQPFLWHNGTTVELPVPLDAINSSASRINNSSQVTGLCLIPDIDGKGYVRRGLFWSGGSLIDLPLFKGCTDSNAGDINDYGMFIFGCKGPEISIQGFWWNGSFYDLMDEMPPDWTFLGFSTINNAGQIIGQAAEPGGESFVFTLTPVPAAPGDFNCDKLVNVEDLLGVVRSWRIEGGGPADFNGDKIVNVPDLLIVIQNWTG